MDSQRQRRNYKNSRKVRRGYAKAQSDNEHLTRAILQVIFIFDEVLFSYRRCDPVLTIDAHNPTDLMNVMTDCNCGNPVVELSKSESSASEVSLST